MTLKTWLPLLFLLTLPVTAQPTAPELLLVDEPSENRWAI